MNIIFRKNNDQITVYAGRAGYIMGFMVPIIGPYYFVTRLIRNRQQKIMLYNLLLQYLIGLAAIGTAWFFSIDGENPILLMLVTFFVFYSIFGLLIIFEYLSRHIDEVQVRSLLSHGYRVVSDDEKVLACVEEIKQGKTTRFLLYKQLK